MRSQFTRKSDWTDSRGSTKSVEPDTVAPDASTSKLQALCNDLDMIVLHDIAESDGRRIPLFAVGWEDDFDAQIVSGVITPWFTSFAALAVYCETHYEEILDAGMPDSP
jgi:hypothetical protein